MNHVDICFWYTQSFSIKDIECCDWGGVLIKLLTYKNKIFVCLNWGGANHQKDYFLKNQGQNILNVCHPQNGGECWTKISFNVLRITNIY